MKRGLLCRGLERYLWHAKQWPPESGWAKEIDTVKRQEKLDAANVVHDVSGSPFRRCIVSVLRRAREQWRSGEIDAAGCDGSVCMIQVHGKCKGSVMLGGRNVLKYCEKIIKNTCISSFSIRFWPSLAK